MTTYTYPLSDFPNSEANLTNLETDIRSSSIVAALDHIEMSDSIVNIIFKTEIDSKNLSTLDTIIATHNSVCNTNTVTNVNIIPENIKFFEAGDVTNDMYRAESWVMDITPDVSIQSFYFYKPFNISLLSTEIDSLESMIGDELDVVISPDTIIGGLTSGASVGDVSVNVSSTVSDNLIPGRFLSIDSVNYHEVTHVDKNANVITLDTPLTVSKTAGNYVYMNIALISHLRFYTTQHIEIGKSISTGQRMPANVPIRVLYKNNTKTSKTLVFFIEYLY